MSRPPFALTDDQARILSLRVPELERLYPLSTKNHRPFVRAFVQAVWEATGKGFSPRIYRRLLNAYAPQRRPSTATLSAERDRLDAILTTRSSPDVVPPDGTAIPVGLRPADLAAQVRLAVAGALEDSAAAHSAPPPRDASQLDYFMGRLHDTEAELRQVRHHAADLLAALAASRARQETMQGELASLKDLIRAQGESIAQLVKSADEHRKFALIAIEESRGETRIWKARVAELELSRAKDEQTMESLRRRILAREEPPR